MLTYSAGCLALPHAVTSKFYATASAAGEYNNPWNGDTSLMRLAALITGTSFERPAQFMQETLAILWHP